MKTSSLPTTDRVLTAVPTLLESASKNDSHRSQSSLAVNPGLKSNKESLPRPQLSAIALVTPPEKLQSLEKPQKRVWGVFCSTFFTIFLAEMGDKTQLATLLMSAESQSPWVVFTGAAIALIATSLIGVLIGSWLSQRLSPKTLETSAGVLLLFISLSLLWDVMQIGG